MTKFFRKNWSQSTGYLVIINMKKFLRFKIIYESFLSFHHMVFLVFTETGNLFQSRFCPFICRSIFSVREGLLQKQLLLSRTTGKHNKKKKYSKEREM